MGMRIFVVLESETHGEPNADGDEYTCMENGGMPRHAYRSEAAARAKQAERERHARLQSSPCEYCYENPFGDDEVSRIRELEGVDEDFDIGDLQNVWDDLPEDTRLQIWRIAGIVDQLFFEVRETEVEDCQVREPAHV